VSSVLDLIECKQCGYEEADYEFYCRTCEDVTTCRHCGYHERWTAKCDEEGKPCGWKHEIDFGFGALWYGSKDQGLFTSHCLHSAQELADAETWLREQLAKGEIEHDVAYLTRWNKQTRELELIVGELPKGSG